MTVIDPHPLPASQPGALPGRESLLAMLALAGRAPSIHNTQPWQWRITPDALELRADRSRQLEVADPDGHSLRISCGAALALAQVVLAGAGWGVTVQRLPDPADPDLLARLTGFHPRPVTDDDRALVAAAITRFSDRRPFASGAVPEEVVEALQAATDGPGAHVSFVTRPELRTNLAVAVAAADRSERQDPAYLAEMARWIKQDLAEGIPPGTVPHVEPSHPRHTALPLRDFEAGRPGAELIRQDVDEDPLIAVVLAPADFPANQLQAGEAMMRLMLGAERAGLTSCPVSQSVDYLAFRARLRALMGWTSMPQMLLRIGYPSTDTPPPPATPRRPVADTVVWG